MAQGAKLFLMQEPDSGRTTLVDTHNCFNKLVYLEIMWTVRHRWPAGARFTFNCYKDWVQILLIHPGDLPFVILIRERVTQGDPLSMVLYRIPLIPLSEEL